MDHIVYQQWPGNAPVRQSNHRTVEDAIEAAEQLLFAWRASGGNAPSVFVAYNGTRSIEEWRDGVRIPLNDSRPAHYVNQLTEMGVTRPLSRAIRVF